MDFWELLQQLCVANRDDGHRFTYTERFDRINTLLWNSKYRRINPDGLFFLYAAKPLEEIQTPILISSHIDCVREMTRLFSRAQGAERMHGTYDNAITNAAVLWLMLEGVLPENVLVAFTGDEEYSSQGATQLARYLEAKGRSPAGVMVLDVTDMAWQEQADFTVENDFWYDSLGRRVIRAAEATGFHWCFVPSDPEEIPSYVPCNRVIHEEATGDESWEYDECDLECFSLCLPVDGEMHSNDGVLARTASIPKYIEALRRIATALAG